VQIIREQIEAGQGAFARRNLGINLKLPGEAVRVAGDRHRLTRVFRNLGDNAARYTPRGREVSVQAEIHGDMVRICFSNPVETLTRADLPHLFERFYRGEKSRSRRHGGAGIGLAIVKELVEAHQGNVGAELLDNDLHLCIELPLIVAS
jgi:signal transduction histidine kinase